VVNPHNQSLNLSHMPGGNIATAYFRPQLPPKLEFDTDRLDITCTTLLKRQPAQLVRLIGEPCVYDACRAWERRRAP
jgi:hypothetical protein